MVLEEGPSCGDTLAVTDTELGAAFDDARRGDEDGMRIVFRALQPLLLRYLRHRVPAAAEDVASETWLAAARALPAMDGGVDEFRAWLFSVARNKVADHYRGAARRPPADPWAVDMDVADPIDHADAVADDLDAQGAVRELVRLLSPDQAEVVMLRVVADLSVEEVARIMGRSPASVRVLQHRALKRMARAARMSEIRPGV